ncbi:MAG TPA: thioredoxin [Mycobacteriales bacterium]|nr:thioredoxin [Mycobacteriales bacterium]
MTPAASTATVSASRIVRCENCGKNNRVPAVADGIPRCGQCRSPLPWIADADDATFEATATHVRVPVLVDLWAPWCGPCRAVSPALEQVARRLAGRLKLVKVNVDSSPSVAQRFEVQAVPTLLVLKDGNAVGRQAGAASAQALEAWVERTLAGS